MTGPGSSRAVCRWFSGRPRPPARGAASADPAQGVVHAVQQHDRTGDREPLHTVDEERHRGTGRSPGGTRPGAPRRSTSPCSTRRRYELPDAGLRALLVPLVDRVAGGVEDRVVDGELGCPVAGEAEQREFGELDQGRPQLRKVILRFWRSIIGHLRQCSPDSKCTGQHLNSDQGPGVGSGVWVPVVMPMQCPDGAGSRNL